MLRCSGTKANMCAWSALCPSSYRSECLKKCWKKSQHSQQPNCTWISLTVLGRGRLSSRHLKGDNKLNEMCGTRRLLWKLFAVFFWPKGFRNLNQGEITCNIWCHQALGELAEEYNPVEETHWVVFCKNQWSYHIPVAEKELVDFCSLVICNH